jgi:hypothetical protein
MNIDLIKAKENKEIIKEEICKALDKNDIKSFENMYWLGRDNIGKCSE